LSGLTGFGQVKNLAYMFNRLRACPTYFYLTIIIIICIVYDEILGKEKREITINMEDK
jgi:hypothetical protein